MTGTGVKALARLIGLSGIAALAFLAGCEGGGELVEGTDLKIVALRIPSVTGLRRGTTVDLTVLVKNNGTERITEPFMTRIDFYDDAALTDESSWSSTRGFARPSALCRSAPSSRRG